MHKIKSTTRLGVLLATLGVIALTFAGRASAAIAMVPLDGGGAVGNGYVPIKPPAVHTIVHTVIVGGMPGWQIAAIAIAAALVAGTAAVLLDRARSVRHRLPVTAA